jgi:hypothetical protein
VSFFTGEQKMRRWTVASQVENEQGEKIWLPDYELLDGRGIGRLLHFETREEAIEYAAHCETLGEERMSYSHKKPIHISIEVIEDEGNQIANGIA